MSTTIKSVVEAFELFFTALHQREFRKTIPMHEWSERELLPLIRTFLLGYFGESLIPEAKSKLPGSLSGHGRIDFIVGGVAVEVAVRRPSKSGAALSNTVNSTEAKKLMKYDGSAVLVLLDFSAKPFEEAQIESFRDWPSLGKGNHKKSAFNVVYFYVANRRPLQIAYIKKNIRVS
jgi:hypothetical protein